MSESPFLATSPAPDRSTVELSPAKQRLLAATRGGAAERSGAPEPVARLREGEGPAVVLVHPVGGQLLSYLELVRLLPPDWRVVGLAADHLLTGGTATRIELLAAHYRDRLVRAAVPIRLLVGWSFGGLVAYEMARQLAATGPCPPIVLLDTEVPDPGEHPGTDEGRVLQQFAFDLVHSSGDHADVELDDGPWSLPPPEALPVLADQLAARGVELGLPPDELLGHYLTYRGAHLTLHTYQPPVHSGPVHLVEAAQSYQQLAAAWEEVASDLRVSRVPATHHALLRPPAVETVADLVRLAAD